MLPLPDGPGKALRLTVVPVRERIPVYLASLGPKNLELTGETADGWLGLFVSAEHVGESLDRLRAGRARRRVSTVWTASTSARRARWSSRPTAPRQQVVAAAAEPVRGYAALYVGGMGSKDQNFYNALARRMGYEEAAEQVQEAYLDRRPRDAAAAVPTGFVDATSLLGPVARVAERMAALADAGVTTLNVVPFAPDLAGPRGHAPLGRRGARGLGAGRA